MTHPHITFIGAGNMSTSIIGGLVTQGHDTHAITACDPNTDALTRLVTDFGINTESNNNDACQNADVIVLAVKPQILQAVAKDLYDMLQQRQNPPLIISIAAGITSQHLGQWLGQTLAIVRCMPNTPALIQQGASGLFANSHTSATQKQLTETLLKAVGVVSWVDNEDLIDSVTAVSGSGPAYFFLMMEAMIEAGIKQGLSQQTATTLTLQTALGAAKLAQSSDVNVDELRRRVTSPGGTTEQAILSFEQDGLRNTVDKAMQACADRSVAMAKEFS